MAASTENVRVRLNFESHCGLTLGKTWFLVNTQRLKTIEELTEQIRERFDVGCGLHLELYIDGCVLPGREAVGILRDNDLINIVAVDKVNDVGKKKKQAVDAETQERLPTASQSVVHKKKKRQKSTKEVKEQEIISAPTVKEQHVEQQHVEQQLVEQQQVEQQHAEPLPENVLLNESTKGLLRRKRKKKEKKKLNFEFSDDSRICSEGVTFALDSVHERTEVALEIDSSSFLNNSSTVENDSWSCPNLAGIKSKSYQEQEELVNQGKLVKEMRGSVGFEISSDVEVIQDATKNRIRRRTRRSRKSRKTNLEDSVTTGNKLRPVDKFSKKSSCDFIFNSLPYDFANDTKSKGIREPVNETSQAKTVHSSINSVECLTSYQHIFFDSDNEPDPLTNNDSNNMSSADGSLNSDRVVKERLKDSVEIAVHGEGKKGFQIDYNGQSNGEMHLEKMAEAVTNVFNGTLAQDSVRKSPCESCESSLSQGGGVTDVIVNADNSLDSSSTTPTSFRGSSSWQTSSTSAFIAPVLQKVKKTKPSDINNRFANCQVFKRQRCAKTMMTGTAATETPVRVANGQGQVPALVRVANGQGQVPASVRVANGQGQVPASPNTPQPIKENMTPAEPVKDYSKYDLLLGPPRSGDFIAYKILLLDADYSPIVSNYKEAKVLSFTPANRTVQLEPLTLSPPTQEVKKAVGRFDLTIEDENEILTNSTINTEQMISVLWDHLLEPRLLG